MKTFRNGGLATATERRAIPAMKRTDLRDLTIGKIMPGLRGFSESDLSSHGVMETRAAHQPGRRQTWFDLELSEG